MQKRISLIGNLGNADGCFNGQTVKTKIVTDELIRYFGSNQVDIFNTSAGLKVLFAAPLIAFKAVKKVMTSLFYLRKMQLGYLCLYWCC